MALPLDAAAYACCAVIWGAASGTPDDVSWGWKNKPVPGKWVRSVDVLKTPPVRPAALAPEVPSIKIAAVELAATAKAAPRR
jgi:hypothetical protein